MLVQDRQLQVSPDRTIAYQVFPAASDRHHITLVLVHGLGSSCAAWWKTLAVLSDQVELPTIIVIDCLGHGLSSRPKGVRQYDFDRLADDVMAVMDHEKADRVLLVGHCLGSLLSQLIMVQIPEKINQAILLNTTSQGTVGIFNLLWLVYPLLRLLSHLLPTWHLTGRYDYHHFTSTPDISIKRLLYDVAYTSFRSNLICGLNAMRFHTPLALYRSQIPTLVVAGGQDSIYPSRMGKKLADQLPRGQYLCLPDANHITPVNAYQQLSQILTDTIQATIRVQ